VLERRRFLGYRSIDLFLERHPMPGLSIPALARRAALPIFGLMGGLIIGYAVSSQSAGLPLKLLVYGAICLGIALALPPHVFLPAALVVVGVSTAFASAVISIGPATLYVSDLAVLAIFLRGALPRERHPGPRALAGLPQALFLVWILIMAVAGLRAFFGGIPTSSVLRGDVALFYWPLLYVGFTRVLAEVDLNVSLLWRNLALVAVGFVVYMFGARALNHPFNAPGLALVPTGPGESVPRNFGFASAFSIYPVLAIAGVAGMASKRTARTRWIFLAAIGTIATLTTLVRGEIFALALGILVVLWVTPRAVKETSRTRTALQLGMAIAVSLCVVLVVNPSLGRAVVQRALPFTHQAQAATENTDYRLQAMQTGIRVARAHPTGLGVQDEPSLIKRGIDPGYLPHSGLATLAIFGGWLALGASVLAILSLIRRSFQTVAASDWLHPAFVGAIVMLSGYSLGAAGLAGDTWVIPLGALVVALRFALRPDAR
jgi:O-Antigen ligase